MKPKASLKQMIQVQCLQRDQEPESPPVSSALYCSSSLCLDVNSKIWFSTEKIGFPGLFLYHQSFDIPWPVMKSGQILNQWSHT